MFSLLLLLFFDLFYLINILEKNLSYILLFYKYYILQEQRYNWWLCSQICYDSMYVKIDGELKTIK